MHLTRYTIAPDGFTILAEQGGLLEFGCASCGVQWLPQLEPTTEKCPYCSGHFAVTIHTPGIEVVEAKYELPNWYSPIILAEQSASYAKDIRGWVRAFWNGSIDYDTAFGGMYDTVELGLTGAWDKGALECGIAPDELTPEERIARDQAIHQERTYINGFLAAVEQGSKAKGGKLAPFLMRAELWANRWNDVLNRSKILACGNQKLAWRLNYVRVTKDHCADCSRLANKVKRASQWMDSGWQPQGHMLACGGWRCGCGLEVTDEPLSKGRLPMVAW